MLKVNFTRMELMRLQRRLALARRGHRLLKDKEEQLMAYFYRLIEQARGTRGNLEERFRAAVESFQEARAPHPAGRLAQFLDPPAARLSIECPEAQVLNIALPRFQLRPESEGTPAGEARLDMVETVGEYRSILQPILRLAEMERALVLFAREIETTRRRVNSLEHILIPELEETTRAIKMRLEEMERENFVRLRHIKRLGR